MKRLLLPGRGHKWYVNLKGYYEFDAATGRGLERVVNAGDPSGFRIGNFALIGPKSNSAAAGFPQESKPLGALAKRHDAARPEFDAANHRETRRDAPVTGGTPFGRH